VITFVNDIVLAEDEKAPMADSPYVVTLPPSRVTPPPLSAKTPLGENPVAESN
jgi:hypothetical protein